MISYIQPERIANAIKMKDENNLKNYIIVEGESDSLLFEKFRDKNICEIEIAFGYSNVIAVVETLIAEGFDGVLGIIDADFRVLNNENFEEGSILLSDCHDMEIMFICSDSFTAVLNSYKVKQRLESSWGDFDNFKAHLFELAKHIGHLKFINYLNQHGLKFKPDSSDGKSIDYAKFIDVKTLEYLGHDKLIETVLNYDNQQARIKIKKGQLLSELQNIAQNLEITHLCNGHDCMEIIALSLKKNISNLNAKAIEAKQIQKEFILSYDSRFFIESALYNKIKNWEKQKDKTVLNC